MKLIRHISKDNMQNCILFPIYKGVYIHEKNGIFSLSITGSGEELRKCKLVLE